MKQVCPSTWNNWKNGHAKWNTFRHWMSGRTEQWSLRKGKEMRQALQLPPLNAWRTSASQTTGRRTSVLDKETYVRGWEVAENPVARDFRVELQRGKKSTKGEFHRSQELFPQVLSSVQNRAWWVWRNCLRIVCLQCRRLGSIPGSGRSPGEGNGNPLQYSCLENSLDRGAWQVTVHEVTSVGHNLATKPPPHSKGKNHPKLQV